MLGVPAAVKWAMILGLVVTTLGTAWGVVRYIEKSAVVALQRDQLVEAVRAKDEAIADRNRIAARFSALPVDRLRLCVQRAPTDGCCKPAPAECVP